jgi:hypothetical protein
LSLDQIVTAFVGIWRLINSFVFGRKLEYTSSISLVLKTSSSHLQFNKVFKTSIICWFVISHLPFICILFINSKFHIYTYYRMCTTKWRKNKILESRFVLLVSMRSIQVPILPERLVGSWITLWRFIRCSINLKWRLCSESI